MGSIEFRQEVVALKVLAASPLIFQVRCADPAQRYGAPGERWVGLYARFVVIAALKPVDPSWAGSVIELPTEDDAGEGDWVKVVHVPEGPPVAVGDEFLIFAEPDPTPGRATGRPVRFAHGELRLPLSRRAELPSVSAQK